MRFFVDSANLDEIASVARRGFARGLTTNPTLLRANGVTDPIGHLRRIVDVVRDAGLDWPVHVQVMTTAPAEMVLQAEQLVEEIGYEHLVVKVPCTWDGLEVIHRLADRQIAVNCTACITSTQAQLAAAAGARYVTLFYGKMGDAGMDAAATVSATTGLVEPFGTEVVIGSIRKPYDLVEMAAAGAHVATVKYADLRKVAEHEKSAEGITNFAKDFIPLVASEATTH